MNRGGAAAARGSTLRVGWGTGGLGDRPDPGTLVSVPATCSCTYRLEPRDLYHLLHRRRQVHGVCPETCCSVVC